MMKLRLSLKNLARRVLNLCIIACLIGGCSSSTAPTYQKKDIEKSIQDICKNEYKLDVKVKLVGSTLWIYVPIEGLIEKSNKPEKFTEKFNIEQNKGEFANGNFKFNYSIKPIPEQVKFQDFKYNKKALENINNVWKVLRRVIFSMQCAKGEEPEFYSLIFADMNMGIQIKELSYYLDLKKVSYGYISWEEYQHRSILDQDLAPEAIQDREGLHINYKDITLKDFVLAQIQHRIKLKFQKPEVDKNVDIDKEILKIIEYTLKTYNFKGFSEVELNNLLTNSRVILNQAAIWEKPIERKF
jgi:hypothetical protein